MCQDVSLLWLFLLVVVLCFGFHLDGVDGDATVGLPCAVLDAVAFASLLFEDDDLLTFKDAVDGSFYTGALDAGLEIYWGNELFYLHIKGEGDLDEIITYVENEAPDSKDSKGYVHKDQHDIPPLSVFFNDQEKQGSTYWALANSAFRAELPFTDAEYQNPGEEPF